MLVDAGVYFETCSVERCSLSTGKKYCVKIEAHSLPTGEKCKLNLPCCYPLFWLSFLGASVLGAFSAGGSVVAQPTGK